MTTPGFSPNRLARLHAVLAGYVERGEVPGLVALLSRRGETRVETLGSLALSGSPLPSDALFRIASMTKPVTAVAALILVEECRLRLDDPLDPWLPELSGRRVLAHLDGPLDETVPAWRALTLRDLLTFRLGFGQVFAPPDSTPILQAANSLNIGMGPPRPDELPAPDEWLRRLGSLPLMHQPGEAWLYNTGADILGVLIARASGLPFEDFLRERLFNPLGMRDTSFSVPPEKIARLTDSYGVDPSSGALSLNDPAAGGQWSRPPAFPSGAAGLVSTAADYFAFARMLLNGGSLDGARILSRPMVELMTSDQLTPAQKSVSGLVPGYFDAHGWGFGLSVVTRRDGLMNPGAYGWDGGLGTSWYNDPREDLVALLLTQRAWTSPALPPVSLDFCTTAYAALED